MNTHNIWFLSPIVAVLLAVLAITVTGGPGLDGAARSTVVVFWFLPVIIWLGYMCFSNYNLCEYSRLIKAVLILLWFIPSIPLSLMSLYGLLLIPDTGIGILF